MRGAAGSERYDSPLTGIPSFSRPEDSETFGPHIEGSIESGRYHPDSRQFAYLGTFFFTLGGSDATGYASFNGRASADWMREAAAVLLDTADAVDEANRRADQ